MKRLLLATDGSSHANAALDIAAALALRDDSEVYLLHVVTDREPNEATRHAIEVEFADELVERSRSAMLLDEPDDGERLAKLILSRQGSVARAINSIMGQAMLERAETDLRERGVERIVTRLVEGHPSERILELAAEREVHAIVMGSHGHGRLEGVLMGSVSQSVAHRARCTVISVT